MSEKILIIDNDPDMLMLLSLLIREMTPHETVATNNPLEAIEMIEKGGFSLVITEMKMPVMDGIELLEAVRSIDEDIQVIIISINGTTESAIEAMHKGVFDYIAKPFRKEQILYAIDNALKLVKLTRKNRELKECLEKVKGERISLTTVH